MKNLSEIIFINNLPTLDLHGYDSQTAVVAINDFIKDNLKLQEKFIVIIHGIGTGVLKSITFDTLKHNKNVIEYRLDYYNSGCTLVNLKIVNSLRKCLKN